MQKIKYVYSVLGRTVACGATVFTIAERWGQPKCPPVDDGVNKS